jgi:aspartate/methionine/tyrosine aminotransferase
MHLEAFDMERLQSTYENLVELNLSESGVLPMSPRELLADPEALAGLLDQPLVYTQSNGTAELRARIAALYPGATIDHVEVTNGGSEANYVSTWRLVEPGDEVVLLVPTYMQIRGLARGFGGTVREWPLLEDSANGRWRVDLDRLHGLVTTRTKLIVICNPNNPTGARLDSDDLDGIARQADRVGAWILSDEIYRGAEIDGHDTPSMWGRSSRVLITSGLSKAYGLPGLRIGWIVGPPDVVASCWSYHDYTTIAPGALSDRLARHALEPERRRAIVERTRTIIRTNLPVLGRWLAERSAVFSWIPPEAGAIGYVRYRHRMNSTELVTRLREEKSVLIVPGDHFGMDHYLRIGFGEAAHHVAAGLGRLHDLLATLPVPDAAAVSGA